MSQPPSAEARWRRTAKFNSELLRNKLARNTGYGLFVDAGAHVYLNNVLLGNVTGAVGGPEATGLTDGGGNIQ